MFWELNLPWWATASAAIFATSAALAGLWWIWWILPKRQADHLQPEIPEAKARVDIEDSYRKTIGQLIGGAAVPIGTGFAYYQFLGQQNTSQKQLESAHDQLISQLFKA